jgi:hypothetical protein
VPPILPVQFVRVMTNMGRDLGFFGVVWGILVMAVRCGYTPNQDTPNHAEEIHAYTLLGRILPLDACSFNGPARGPAEIGEGSRDITHWI